MFFTYAPRHTPASWGDAGACRYKEKDQLPDECQFVRDRNKFEEEKALLEQAKKNHGILPPVHKQYNKVEAPMTGRWARVDTHHFQNTGILLELIELERKRRLKRAKLFLKRQEKQKELENAWRKAQGQKQDAFSDYLRQKAIEAMAAENTEDKLVKRLQEESRVAYVQSMIMYQAGGNNVDPTAPRDEPRAAPEWQNEYALRMEYTPSALNAKKQRQKQTETGAAKNKDEAVRMVPSIAALAAEEFWRELEHEAADRLPPHHERAGAIGNLKCLNAVLGTSVAESKAVTNLQGPKKTKGPQVQADMKNELAAAFGGLSSGVRQATQEAAAAQADIAAAADDDDENGAKQRRSFDDDLSSEDEVGARLQKMKAEKEAASQAILAMGKSKSKTAASKMGAFKAKGRSKSRLG
ncbi:unnamed protein product [Amoebophrya sp. A120]|nr:unnamed protein product [Amoebophrya sp. A120]|eukprot:GSA120T00023585001.1